MPGRRGAKGAAMCRENDFSSPGTAVLPLAALLAAVCSPADILTSLCTGALPSMNIGGRAPACRAITVRMTQESAKSLKHVENRKSSRQVNLETMESPVNAENECWHWFDVPSTGTTVPLNHKCFWSSDKNVLGVFRPKSKLSREPGVEPGAW